jgi:nucleoside diphosphate kinase
MYEGEQVIQEALNEVGQLATGELLSRFDTDGSPIVIGKMKLTSKGQIGKTYQTPYGAIELSRHVYQSSEGGATYCPLEVNT